MQTGTACAMLFLLCNVFQMVLQVVAIFQLLQLGPFLVVAPAWGSAVYK